MSNNNEGITYSEEVQELIRKLSSQRRPQLDPPDEVQELIQQLSRLQLQQTDLLARLGRAREVETRTSLESPIISDTTTSADVLNQQLRQGTSRENQRRRFRIGDKVRILNPGRFQANKGEITKIGESRVTIKTWSGSKLQRAPKNITLDHE
jgi:transcription antitermination factor NusG